jgi:hypothetical protein
MLKLLWTLSKLKMGAEFQDHLTSLRTSGMAEKG